MKKEFPYLILCAVLCAVLIVYSFNFLLFLEDATLDINAHDTYFTADFIAVLLDSFTFTFALMYFFRTLYTKFKNRLVNYLYVIFNGLFIVAFSFSIWSMYRLVETLETIGINEYFGFSQHLYILATILLVAIVLEIYTIIRLRNQR